MYLNGVGGRHSRRRAHGRQLQAALLAVLRSREGGDRHLVLRHPLHLHDFTFCISPYMSMPLLECVIVDVFVICALVLSCRVSTSKGRILVLCMQSLQDFSSWECYGFCSAELQASQSKPDISCTKDCTMTN